ncbi:uncharacterized protein F4807DRAFT_111963 [Annulohypoxylon truncatum]|uniref:uncharacterized protein n=1 Tax=Annulohypoxylon truncatum TaxID=327061 RepID=UPI0020078798|nr:uncharacterized protein F4807DRAFT_111963 [Annulohypoxylon truncatum]KAI1214034.1 hypothetical protein F4807DRAFT_111963 [Annulohypoxylon truncatum]
MVSSPSDFIYRSRDTSLALSAQINPTMESLQATASSTCQHHEPPASNYTPWETVSHGLPECTRPSRRATFPNAQRHNEHQGGLQHELPRAIYAPMRRVCLACHQDETPNSPSVGTVPETTVPQYHHEPTVLASSAPLTDSDRPYAPSIGSDNSSQVRFPIPRIADPTSFPGHSSPAATRDTGSRTSSTYSSNPERVNRIFATVHAVHDICLQSTKTWLDTHLVNRRARASNSSLLSGQQADSADGTSTPIHLKVEGGSEKGISSESKGSYADINRNGSARGNGCGPIPPSTNSLLKNISSICNMLWVGSQRDRLDVLNVERTTVGIMSHLLCWAETVALGDYDEWKMAEEEALLQVLQAGQNLCNWLDVPHGIQAIEVLYHNITESGYEVI